MCDDGSEEERKRSWKKKKVLNVTLPCFFSEKLLNWVTLHLSIFHARFLIFILPLHTHFLLYSNYFHSTPTKCFFFVDISSFFIYVSKCHEICSWNIFIFIISISPINDFKVAIIYTLGTLYNSLSSRMIQTTILEKKIKILYMRETFYWSNFSNIHIAAVMDWRMDLNV